MGRGMLEAVQDQYDDKAAQAQTIYDRKEAAYTALSTLGSAGIDKLPGGGFITDTNSLRGSLYDRRKEAFEEIEREASGNATALPDISFIEIMLASPTDVVMDAVIGMKPIDEKSVRSFNANDYRDFEGMLAVMPSLSETFRTDYPDFFDAAGKLKRSAELERKTRVDVSASFETMFSKSGASDSKSSSRIRAAFDSIVDRDR